MIPKKTPSAYWFFKLLTAKDNLYNGNLIIVWIYFNEPPLAWIKFSESYDFEEKYKFLMPIRTLNLFDKLKFWKILRKGF